MALGCLEICNAACCRNLKKIELTIVEYFRLISAGAILWQQNDGENIYRMEGDCPFLLGNRCSVRGTDLQPQICKIFRFMSFQCRDTRFCNPSLVLIHLANELEADKQFSLKSEFRFAAASSIGKWFW